jgi:hypothetical protein
MPCGFRSETAGAVLALLLAGAPGLGPGALGQEGRAGFSDVASEAGVVFLHENGASSEKYLPETMGGGGLFFDYDNDGWIDILLVDGGSFLDSDAAARARNALFRNRGDGRFVSVPDSGGLLASNYGMGACAADYDNDGWKDVYVTSVGPNRLFRNTGVGTFLDVTEQAGVGYAQWSAGCAFGDFDNDGDLDLYVTNYADFSVEGNKYCGDLADVRLYCSPVVYDPLSDVLYRNDGDGSFTDISIGAGLSGRPGYGLGVVLSDYDRDGRIDIYVANDGQPNFLWRNLGAGRFEERALLSGVAVGSDGQPQAGMGTDMGDVNGDGLPDIVVTNLDQEGHSLYFSSSQGLFSDVTFASGVGRITLPFVGFGAVLVDYDNDGDMDLVIANGGVFDNSDRFRDATTHRQRNLLLENDGGGEFSEAGVTSGTGFEIEKVSRGLAAGDIDNDGDPDLLVVNNGDRADLLRNDLGSPGNALLIRTVGTSSNRDGVGARIEVRVGDGPAMVREIRAGSSYLAQNDSRAHFGLGASERADRVEVHWPGGHVDVLEEVEANYILTVVEGRGVSDRAPLRRAR